MTPIPKKTVRLKCEDCGHEQTVTSAVSYRDADGTEHHWFGSAYDFCDKCDGYPVPIGEEK